LLLAIALSGIISLYIVNGWTAELRRDLILGIAAILSNGIFYLLARYVKTAKSFFAVASSLVAFDVLFISILIYINGGIESRNAILYVFPILVSAALFGRRAIYITTVAAIIAYDFIIIGNYLNILPLVGAFDPSLHSQFGYVVNSVVFFSSVLMIIGLVVDFITRLLTEKEREVTESLSALKRAQSIARFGSWDWDAKNNKVTWSEELCKIFGTNKAGSAITYEEYLKLLHPKDRDMVDAIIKKSLKNNKPFSFDHRIVRPSGALRYLYARGEAITENGKVVRMLGTAQDITESKLLDEARSDFVALASHQLRTPATAVKQYLGLLIEGYAGSLSDDQSSFARIAYESNDRQLSIVDDLLYVAQVDSGNLKLSRAPTDLMQLLNEIIKDQALKFENKKQILTLSSTYKSLYAEIDGRRLRMAVENILDNAHKYAPNSGRIRLRLARSGKSVIIEVSDNGIGIPKKEITNIFKKFARVNSPATRLSEGTGLGLYLAQRIVRLHKGKIKVDSKPGKGTKFTITLPINNSK
jgi:two-component system sensor histidine kinase/response regulator